jgi:2-oxoisovalerate dehydrogenase E2 component (dihydrolipoyl transacylase)
MSLGRRKVRLDEASRWVFNRMADVYDARPPYPAALIDALCDLAGPPGARIADLGAGTGHLALPLAARGYDVTAVEETRQMMNRDRGTNPKLTLLPFLITALSRGLGEWPMLNATFDDEAMVITRHGSVQMGVATQTPNGLMVATIRDAQSRSVWDLASEILRLSEAARSGKATREELTGATFTISSLGPMGGITSTPVVNPPQVAIVAVNKIEEKLVPINGEIEVRKHMNLSLSCDHRVIDGWDAASFMQTLKGYIENPLRLLSA